VLQSDYAPQHGNAPQGSVPHQETTR